MAYESIRWHDYMGATLLICSDCVHRELFEMTCKAFPEGIPNGLMDRNEHDTPFPGDHGIRYKKREE